MHRFIAFLVCFNTKAETLTRQCGRSVAWLSGVLAVVTLMVVLLRVALQWGSVSLQESQTYLHATLIMLAAAYTLAEDGHVRVDIFYRNFNPVRKAWINALGSTLLLLPFAVFSFAISFQYVATAWSIREASADAGGIAAVYLLKSLILFNALLLSIQALADIARNLSIISRDNDA